MYKNHLERRKILRGSFLKRNVFVAKCKGSPGRMLHAKTSKKCFINGTFIFLNSDKFDSKNKVCNDEWTDLCESYSPLEPGQQGLFNHESNENENEDEFFLSVPVDQLTFDDCSICLEKLNNGEAVSQLTRCVHQFHTDCIQGASDVEQRCPVCRVCGPNYEGDCPPGRMKWKVSNKLKGMLAGYEDCEVIVIGYQINGGYQDARHENPGVWYDGVVCEAYLPDNNAGNRVLEMLKNAWTMKKTFTIGRNKII